MNSKEIIISAIVLILLLVGLILFIKLASDKAAKSESAEVDLLNAGKSPTTEDVGKQESLGETFKGDLPFSTPEEAAAAQAQAQAQAQATAKAQAQAQKNTGFEEQRTQQEKTLSKPEMKLKDGVDYHAVIQTNFGNIDVDLLEKETPITVNNFVYLATTGFYDNLIFHRVIDDFMIQGGDPLGNGSGNPGYSFEDEIVRGQSLDKGSLAMANSGPDTNGSQFFIVTKEGGTPWLNKVHTKFGQVTAGQDIADKISKVAKDANDKPLEDVVIETVLILEK